MSFDKYPCDFKTCIGCYACRHDYGMVSYNQFVHMDDGMILAHKVFDKMPT